MSATHPFKVGDRVRRRGSLPNNYAYQVGSDPFKIVGIRDGYVTDWHDGSHAPENLELVESAPSEPPSVEEYNDPARERLLRQIDDLNAVVRRRNEQIATLQEQLKEKQALLEESMVGSALNSLADQLGLGAPEATSALELGARLLVLGVTFSDIQEWRERDMKEELRVRRRIAAHEETSGGEF